MSVRAIHGDMLEVIPRLVAEGVVCDACVTDAPYHLLPTVKRFGAATSWSGDVEDGRYHRMQSGFMGQKWDGGDIAFRPETWGTVATILRPGGFLLAFGGTRTHHRLACAIEDAGFVIQDCLMWLFATGFPKRRDALKPAYEPVVLAYKPGGKRTMQVDECRIACIGKTPFPSGAMSADGTIKTGLHIKPRTSDNSPLGRWPANICHDGSDEVVAMFPQVTSGQPLTHHKRRGKSNIGAFDIRERTGEECNWGGDTGSAARFFYSAKAGPEDRWGSRHPTVKPVEIMKWLVKLVTPPDGIVLDPFAGSGTTGVAALAAGRDAILIEREDNWFADIQERLAFYEGGGLHSTQAKARNRAINYGPLFAEAAE